MSSVNLYDVLNLEKDCIKTEIKESYIKLVKEFHPDKPTGDAEMFELITHAYNILNNIKTRKEYDEIFKLSKQTETDHFDLKSQASNYLKALETNIGTKSKEKQVVDFEKAFQDMDKRHGYKREKEYDALDEKDTKKKLTDLELARKQDDIENLQDKLFEESRFDLVKFNAAFDAIHKSSFDEIIPHKGNPDAWNNMESLSGNFSNLESYDNIFVENDEDIVSPSFCSIKNNTKTKNKKISSLDLNKIKSAEYTEGHKVKEKDYDKIIEERLKKRELEDEKYKERDMSDFDTEGSCGGYGIFDKIGIKNLSTLTWNEDEDIKTRYNKLLELRKKE